MKPERGKKDFQGKENTISIFDTYYRSQGRACQGVIWDLRGMSLSHDDDGKERRTHEIRRLQSRKGERNDGQEHPGNLWKAV